MFGIIGIISIIGNRYAIYQLLDIMERSQYLPGFLHFILLLNESHSLQFAYQFINYLIIRFFLAEEFSCQFLQFHIAIDSHHDIRRREYQTGSEG